MSFNLSNIVIAFLKERPEQKFIAREIAEGIFKKYPKECHEKKIVLLLEKHP